jgi:U3 small nucleolar RNA-associated protein 11
VAEFDLTTHQLQSSRWQSDTIHSVDHAAWASYTISSSFQRYIVYKRTLEQKKIEKLKASLHLLDADDKPANTHTFFVDSEAERAGFDVAKRLDTHPALLDRTYNRPRLSDLVRPFELACEKLITSSIVLIVHKMFESVL